MFINCSQEHAHESDDNAIYRYTPSSLFLLHDIKYNDKTNNITLINIT